jgi:hypothetical protein
MGPWIPLDGHRPAKCYRRQPHGVPPGQILRSRLNRRLCTMLFGPATKTFGFMDAKDPDPTQPYVMWAGTAYEHAILSVAPPTVGSTSGLAEDF